MKDPEVNYTGDELYHLSDNEFGYDAKIEARENGAYALYETKSNWQDHSHTEYDENGNETYHRSEGYDHSWSHRQSDYILTILENLSFEKLQIVEATTTNEYVKNSANFILKNNQVKVKKYTL